MLCHENYLSDLSLVMTFFSTEGQRIENRSFFFLYTCYVLCKKSIRIGNFSLPVFSFSLHNGVVVIFKT